MSVLVTYANFSFLQTRDDALIYYYQSFKTGPEIEPLRSPRSWFNWSNLMTNKDISITKRRAS